MKPKGCAEGLGAWLKEKISDRKLQGTIGPELLEGWSPSNKVQTGWIQRCWPAVPSTKETEAGELS